MSNIVSHKPLNGYRSTTIHQRMPHAINMINDVECQVSRRTHDNYAAHLHLYNYGSKGTVKGEINSLPSLTFLKFVP